MIWDALRSWLAGMIAAALVLTVVYALLPKGRWQTVARGAGGMVLLLVLLRPVMGWDAETFALSYGDCELEIESLTQSYQQSAQRETAALIEEKTAAYIASKGAALGLYCTAHVETEVRDGVPYPVRVTLDIERDAALAAWLSSELGIGEDGQTWAAPEVEVNG